MMTEQAQLPNGWEQCRFGDIAKIRNGYAFKSKDFLKSGYTDNDIPLVRQSQLKGGVIDLSDAVRLPANFLDIYDNYTLKKGDVLIGMSGSIGKVCLYNDSKVSLQNQRTGKIELFAENVINSRFYGLFLSSIENELSILSKGMGVQNISAKDIEALQINLPPLNEQRRIVAKLEALFSELEAGTERLRTARAQLKTYRQAILKHAFEGKLTTDWRTQHAATLEPAEALLKRIQQEREAHYQQQLVDWHAAVHTWEASGKDGKKPSKPKKPKVAETVETNRWIELFDLPEVWCWTSLQSIADEITDGDHQAPPQAPEGVPFIVISNIKNNKVDFSSTKYVPQEYYDALAENRKAVAGDILYTVTGSFGIPAPVNFDFEFCFQRHIALIRPSPVMDRTYIFYALQGSSVFVQAQAVATGTAQKTVPLGGLREFSIPLPPLQEQKQIVAAIEHQFSLIEDLERTIDTELQKAESLRQSILKSAFAGTLVPQDPTDEPASALLARIRSQKAAEKPRKSSKKRVA